MGGIAALSTIAGGPLAAVGAFPATAPLVAVDASPATAGTAVTNVAMHACLQQSTLVILTFAAAVAPATMA